MILDERTYHIIPDHLAEFVENYEKYGLAVQSRILGNLVGYFTTEVGELNTVVHMWGYTSFDERSRRRKLLYEDADWNAYRERNTKFIASMRNRLLVSTRFSPL